MPKGRSWLGESRRAWGEEKIVGRAKKDVARGCFRASLWFGSSLEVAGGRG